MSNEICDGLASLRLTFDNLNQQAKEAYEAVNRQAQALRQQLDLLEQKVKDADPTGYFILRFNTLAWSETVTFERLVELYEETNKARVIADLKGLDYAEFLQTAYWAVIAKHVKDVKGHYCSLCPATEGIEAHHRDYTNHGREIETWMTDLTPLCSTCHALHHDKLDAWPVVKQSLGDRRKLRAKRPFDLVGIVDGDH